MVILPGRSAHHLSIAPKISGRLDFASLSAWVRELKALWKVGHAIRQSANAKWELRHLALSLALTLDMAPVVVVAAMAAVNVVSRPVVLALAGGFGPVLATFIRLHAAADSLGRNASSNLDIRLLDAQARLDGSTATATVRRSKHPFAVRFRQLGNRDDANASRVVAAISGAETDSPSSLCQMSIHISSPV